MIELEHLKTFLAVADAGGIGLGARRLGLAQSAVSDRIGRLERELGVTLMTRQRTGVRLTRAGSALADMVRPAVGAVEACVEDARRRAGLCSGTLTLGVFSYMLEQIGELLAALRRDPPGLDVQLRQVDFASQLLDLREARIDSAVLTWEPNDPGLELQRLSSHPTYVMLSDQHPLATQLSVRFEQIAGEPWPGLPPDVPQAWADQMYMTARRGRRPPVTPEAPRNPDELVPIIASGRAISTIPDYLAPLARQIDGITAVPLEDGDPLVLILARRREKPTPPLLAALFATAATIHAKHEPDRGRHG